MKIKLEAHGAVSVLTVSGPLAGPSFDVLKAGVAKLLAEGKSPLILDLTRVEVAPEFRSRLPELGGYIVHSDGAIADAPSVESCLKLLSSPSANLLADESKLE